MACVICFVARLLNRCGKCLFAVSMKGFTRFWEVLGLPVISFNWCTAIGDIDRQTQLS